MAGWGQPGQRESIVRGERTDPRAVIDTCKWIGLGGTFLVLLIMAGVMLNVKTGWSWIVSNWRWLILFPAAPWVVAGGIVVHVLFYEAYDPNYPPPRKAVSSSQITFPWSRGKGDDDERKDDDWDSDYEI